MKDRHEQAELCQVALPNAGTGKAIVCSSMYDTRDSFPTKTVNIHSNCRDKSKC